jgi:hypothetical protein
MGVKSLLLEQAPVEMLSHDHYSRKGICEIPLPGTGYYMYDIIAGVRVDDSVSCTINQSNRGNELTRYLISNFQAGSDSDIEEREAEYDERVVFDADDPARPSHNMVALRDRHREDRTSGLASRTLTRK